MTIPFASDPQKTAVEQLVSEYLGRPWQIHQARDMSDYACHPSAILTDQDYAVFAKFSDASDGMHQFQVEQAGLRLLRERAGVAIPTPVGIRPVPGGTILVLEAVQAVERTTSD